MTAAVRVTPSARRLVLLTCCFSLFMAQLDATIVNVGLPSIGRSLGGGLGGLQWVVDAYVLLLGSVAISSGAAGDRFGRRRVFMTGLVLFTLASAGCSAAPSLGALLGFRALQGASASLLMPSTLAIIADVFTDPRERAAAVGTWAGVSGLAMVAGPLLGGLLVETVGWRSMFWINVPIGAIALLMTARFVPESRAAQPRALDVVGQTLLVGGLGMLTLGLIQGPSWGWTAPATVGVLVAAAAILAAFAVFEGSTSEPMFDPRLLRRPALGAATTFALLAYAATMGFLFLNTLYLQRLRGFSPLHTGLVILPATVAMALASPLSGRITGRHGPRLPIIAGAALIAAGLGILTSVSAHTPLATLFVAYAVIGVGWGVVNPPITTLAMSALPRARSGMAAAVAGCARQIGATLGVALMGSLAAGSFDSGGAHFGAAADSGSGAIRSGYLVAAGVGVTLATLALVLRFRGGAGDEPVDAHGGSVAAVATSPDS